MFESRESGETLTADAVIVGGGPVGLTMALALGSGRLRRPLKTLVIEARDPWSFVKEGHDARGSALSRSTQAMFQALGVFTRLSADVEDMRGIRVTDGADALTARPALLRFATPEHAGSAAGMVENRLLAKALLEEIEGAPHITLVSNTTLKTQAVEPGSVHLDLSDGRKIQTPLLVGSDGRGSQVRQYAGLAMTSKAYGQTALTFTLSHSLPHHGEAQEHFSPDGVFALLPLTGNRCSVVWATSAAEATRLMGLDQGQFQIALQDHIGDGLGEVSVLGSKQAYPLIMQLAETSVAERVALIGDAAHVIHPLAGLGLNLGFKDAAALAECVHDAMARGEDVGATSVLARYQRWRHFDTVSTIAMIEGLSALFGSDAPPLRALRRLGLQSVDGMVAAKSLFMAEAAGVTGDMPKLMRGILPA